MEVRLKHLGQHHPERFILVLSMNKDYKNRSKDARGCKERKCSLMNANCAVSFIVQ
jgi:hypothetical protein